MGYPYTNSSAEALQPDALTRKVLNLDVTFHWIEGSDRFWFKRETRKGDEFVMVDAETGKETLLSGMPAAPPEPTRADCVVAPDNRHAVLRREDDLWLRDQLSGEERRLTHDGQPHFAYGLDARTGDLQKVARRRTGAPTALNGVLWSPDGRFIIALRQDLRSFPDRLLATEYVAPGEEYSPTHVCRFALAGDEKTPDIHLSLIDVSGSAARSIILDPQALNDYAIPYIVAGVVWWSTCSRKLFLINANRGGSRYGLVQIDLASGETREILREAARFNVRLNPFDYARPNVHVMANGTEVIWYSERTGYGHLYLYDAVSHELKHQITRGEWVVFDLLKVDEVRRLAYFTAATRNTAGNPYYRYLYRVSLDGGEPELLTPEEADHKFSNYFEESRRSANGKDITQSGSSISPSIRFFVDSYSTTEQPPEYVLRRTSGELVAKVLTSDASALYASGWRPPERVMVKAGDGRTDLYGVITRPRDFDPAKKYPVIDSMYPGPQGSFAPRTFVDQLAGGSIHHLQTFADAGFIVVSVDARGTAHRSREFRDAFLRTEDVFGAVDHVAAIRNLAAQRPYMDLERVGVRGQSFGGYGSLRAMLLYPDFFKVAVSATGPDGWLQFPSGISVERFFGVPAESTSARQYYDVVSNTRLASRLKGRVLLIYGGIDENVPFKHACAVFDAFIKADKDIDMLLVPDSPHAVPREAYAIRRSIQYFLHHLAGAVAARRNHEHAN